MPSPSIIDTAGRTQPMAQRLNYGSMDDKAKPKADAAPATKEPAADGADKAPAADPAPAPKADGGEPAKADAKPDDPKARHGVAKKALMGMHKTERRDMHKRHLGDYESMQARHDKAMEDMMASQEAELMGPVDPAPEAPAAE
jgi:hypothetical protein